MTTVFLRRSSADGWQFNQKELFKQHANESSLATRGWIFQERVLSPRIVHFTKSQIFWECNQATIAEDGHIVQDECGVHQVDFSKVVYSDVLNGRPTRRHGLAYPPRWESLIEAYSTLQLTNPDDKLLALSGLALAFARENRGFEEGRVYVAGLWSNDLVSMLAWETTIADLFTLQHRPTQWRAPSFSWAAIDDAVTFEGSHTHMPFTTSRSAQSPDTRSTGMISCHVKHKDNDLFGILEACTVVLAGPLVHGTSLGPLPSDLADRKRGYFPLYDRDMSACGTMQPDCAESLVPGLQVTYLLLPQMNDKTDCRSFLVLVLLQTNTEEYNVHRRIGLGRGPVGMFDGAEVDVVSLV
ncbi:hypothetical protein CLAFUW4_11093 [Fulvia fulva]|uniref:Heterokaryon incompatibility domain-containing protein n=1 Tax=Passalora fulva TaxID=5499 RepID=A0A9Q8URE5_PASFU|nr:uncharacterized protein CLAFUR5_10136 [Fulvia fulva]KAK4619686.1 hypothetical protein CLAFUR4_11098 [Fulvia fulva]KAK4620325.1 hypothetical protein CLAFUR0_11104 [Fulvia fulva]UJO19631.1 hypothetical protein CLAFUR5_10136 [Fulvia fulva]WPV17168.1 hypothetical protein CLAFUW4_11093 [Fulvia fulva]WPV32181.1 hypothetical protein CLAFUW7_11090 [Fulvia fulva]